MQGRLGNNRLDSAHLMGNHREYRANAQVGNNQNNVLDTSKWVINLSKSELTEDQKAVLAEGPNFSISPNNIPNAELISAIETICPKLREDEATELRVDINNLLKQARVLKPNLSKEEITGLKQHSKDTSRVILTVDKGVVLVVMDKEDYINKAQQLLEQPAYRTIPRDPTNKIKAQLITKLRK